MKKLSKKMKKISVPSPRMKKSFKKFTIAVSRRNTSTGRFKTTKVGNFASIIVNVASEMLHHVITPVYSTA